jgi:DNA-3-methyladenine glycosylase II
MGEQTQTQNQTQTQTQTQAQTQPHHDSAASATATGTTTAPTTMEITNGSSLTSSPPAKIPFRPRKIRKLSPDPKSSQIVVAETQTTPKPLATIKSNKSKAAHHQRAVPAAPRIVARSLSCDGEVEIALRHLRSADPLIAPLIDLHQAPTFDTFQTPFLALTRSILYQQLAYKAGTSIYTRFIALCGGEAGVLPETVLALTPQQLRQIGVSGRKASYLHDLARKYQNGILSDSAIVNMDDKSLFTMLTMVNGIGSWSVHMFMIFSLHRPDVLPINDLNVRKGVQLLYSLEELPRPSQMDQLCEKWRPYRSVASWYMWRLAEAKGAPSSAAAVAAGASLPQHQQEEQQQHHQHTQQPQLLDPINSILNLGYDDLYYNS